MATALQLLLIDTHKLLQNSEAYAAYAAKVAQRYRSRDIATKWVVATASCAPLVDKLRTSTADGASWFLALVPLIAIGLLLLNFSKVIQISSELHGKYVEILPALRKLWREMSASTGAGFGTEELVKSWRKDLNDIDTRLSPLRAMKSEMPEINSLKVEAENDCEKYRMPSDTSSSPSSAVQRKP